MASAPEGPLTGKGQDSAETPACVRSDPSPCHPGLGSARHAGLSSFGNTLFGSVCGGELRQAHDCQNLTYGGFSVLFLGWQSSVKVKGVNFGVGQAWLQILTLRLLCWILGNTLSLSKLTSLSVKWG